MNETTRMLADTADRLFGDAFARRAGRAEEGFDPALWDRAAELGLPQLLVPEASGGIGARWQDAGVVMQAMGRFAAPLPLAETILAANVLATVGLEIPQGPLTVAVRADGGLRLVNGGWRFDGTLAGVPWSGIASSIVAVIESQDRVDVVCLRRAAAHDVVHGFNLADEPRDRLTFHDAPTFVAEAHGLDAQRLFDEAALLRIAQMAGALGAALERSIEYARTRRQFGKAIGQFQSVQQSLAIMGAEAAAVDCATQGAFLAADQGDAGFEIACAKLRANQAVEVCASIAHQVHGAIGFTREFDLRQFTQRLMSWRSEYGSDRYWAERLGTAVALRGAEYFWSDLTDRGDAMALVTDP